MLLHMLILLAFAKMQDFAEDSYAWQWALAFAVVTFLFGLFGGPLIAAAISTVIWGLYSWGYFALLRQMADSLILWLMVCIGGIMLPWLLLMKLLANTAVQ
ncbi:hypothetical protein [Eikenella sp. HMSC061C02]|uniref:hypothetical protein n=1 Tax=Eikenella sp. HMSC061C02 TaxID=1715021 RepID=UPI0008B2F149|nr:hypothetical protein [Eikenella sp. HMSC061C02]OFN59776.1 hypothetical protein HMPREF2541_09620 [Eikenella sp. HMSC061C02]